MGIVLEILLEILWDLTSWFYGDVRGLTPQKNGRWMREMMIDLIEDKPVDTPLDFFGYPILKGTPVN